MELIHGEEELWAERVLVEEKKKRKNAEHFYHSQVQFAKEQFFFHLSQEARHQA